jgi:tryptophan synthase alpha chain
MIRAAEGAGPPLPPNRIDLALARRPALVAYLPLGDPCAPAGLAALYAQEGVDVIEVGLPWPDPYLDGDVVRASMLRAWTTGIGHDGAAALTLRIRTSLPDQALAWMAYPEAAAATSFVTLAGAASVDGVLVASSAAGLEELGRRLHERGIHLLQFLALPGTTRDVEAARDAEGFVLVQAAPGRTGTRAQPSDDGLDRVATLRAAGVTAPLLLGFGISTPGQAAAAVRAGASGVVVGSAALEAALSSAADVRRLLRSLREALDAAA